MADFAGYLAGFVEWVLTYLLVAKDGIVYKEDVSSAAVSSPKLDPWIGLGTTRLMSVTSGMLYFFRSPSSSSLHPTPQMRKVYDGSIFFEKTGTVDKHT